MYGYMFKNSSKNRDYKLLLLGQTLPEDFQNNLVNNTHSIEIDHLFPIWILDRKVNSTDMFSLFVQTYYNWLYNNSGYKLNRTSTDGSSLQDIIDIDKTPLEFLKHFVYTYASGFPEHQITGENEKNIRVFIRNIRRDFYQRKSNEQAYYYFFDSLYDDETIDDGPVQVELIYPKEYILRLNGGKFEGWPKIPQSQCCYYDDTGREPELLYCEEDNSEVHCSDMNGGVMGIRTQYVRHSGLTGSYGELLHLGGSCLNNGIIQDSHFFQNYSYILDTNTDTDDVTGLPIYYESLMTLLHPAGLKAFLEMTIDDYIPPDDYDPDVTGCETTVLGNYFAYRLNDMVSLGQCSGCTTATIHDGPTAMFNNAAGDWTEGNAWLTVGPGGITLPYNMPTHTYPDWADGITGDETQYPIKNITIGDFLHLCDISRSLNVGITGCTAQGSPGAC